MPLVVCFINKHAKDGQPEAMYGDGTYWSGDMYPGGGTGDGCQVMLECYHRYRDGPDSYGWDADMEWACE